MDHAEPCNEHLWPYAREFCQRRRPYLTDSEGKTYFDGLTGIAVCGLATRTPMWPRRWRIRLRHYCIPPICTKFPCRPSWPTVCASVPAWITPSSVILVRSQRSRHQTGALKGNNEGIKSPSIVVVDGSFHGRTMATLTATGNRKVHAGFEPLLSGFVRAPFNDIAAVEAIAANNPSVVAVMVEPILGEGGIYIPDDAYLTSLRAICDANNWLLIADEVQSGNARTGKFFAYQHTDILPDVVTTGRAWAMACPLACAWRGRRCEPIRSRQSRFHLWRLTQGLCRSQCGTGRD